MSTDAALQRGGRLRRGDDVHSRNAALSQLILDAHMLKSWYVPADPEAAAALLPRSLDPLENRQVFLNQYVVQTDEQTSGFGAFELSYGGLSVSGHDVGGLPAHWLCEYLNSNAGMRRYTAAHGFPASEGRTRLVRDGDLITASTEVAGAPIVRTSARVGDGATLLRGQVGYITRIAGRLVMGRYPLVAEVADSIEVLSIEFLEAEPPDLRPAPRAAARDRPRVPRNAHLFLLPGGRGQAVSSGGLSMSFLEVVGSRRSVRWFDPGRPVGRWRIQRVLEAARLTGSAGNLQPWRAVVVDAAELDQASRRQLLAANNWQGPHRLAPVWIYWYADPDAAVPTAFLEGLRELLSAEALPAAFGWSEESVRAAIQDGVAAPPGMPRLDRTIHKLPAAISGLLAAHETNAAVTVAALAAVNEGLGCCLHSIAEPAAQGQVKEVLGVPQRFVPVWLQLLGHPAESRDGGGQRPRPPFEQLFAWRRWGIRSRGTPASSRSSVAKRCCNQVPLCRDGERKSSAWVESSSTRSSAIAGSDRRGLSVARAQDPKRARRPPSLDAPWPDTATRSLSDSFGCRAAAQTGRRATPGTSSATWERRSSGSRSSRWAARLRHWPRSRCRWRPSSRATAQPTCLRSRPARRRPRCAICGVDSRATASTK